MVVDRIIESAFAEGGEGGGGWLDERYRHKFDRTGDTRVIDRNEPYVAYVYSWVYDTRCIICYGRVFE